MNKKLQLFTVRLRRAPSGGSAEWLNVTLKDSTVEYDEVRTSNGASTGTEIMEVGFSGLEAKLATQTAQGMSSYSPLPAWYDLQTNFRLDPQPAPGPAWTGRGTTDKL
jgi:type VI protein secretion system component Hcp